MFRVWTTRILGLGFKGLGLGEVYCLMLTNALRIWETRTIACKGPNLLKFSP